MSDYPVSSSAVVEGRRFRPPGLRLRTPDSLPELVVGAEGVAIRAGDWRTAVRYDECAAALRYPDGSWTLVSRDGFFVPVEPAAWRKGDEAVAAIAAAAPQELVVPMLPSSPEETADDDRAKS